METEARYTLVGTLVLIVVALLTLAIVWLAGAADTIAYQTYSIYFRQQSLDGLAVGSPVKMRGIKVGVVDGYRFSKSQVEAVAVTARIDSGVPVRQGAVAYIKRNLVTGIAAIEINNGASANPLLVDAPAGEPYPVIAEGRSDIDKVATAVSRLAVNGAQVLEKMNAVLSDKNQIALSQTLANLNTLSSHLAASKQEVNNMMQGVRDAAGEFRLASASVNQAATRTEASIVSFSHNANAAMATLQHDTRLISEQIQQLSEIGALEITNISRDVRASADTLTTVGQQLSNPRTILFGPDPQQLGPGEKLP